MAAGTGAVGEEPLWAGPALFTLVGRCRWVWAVSGFEAEAGDEYSNRNSLCCYRCCCCFLRGGHCRRYVKSISRGLQTLKTLETFQRLGYLTLLQAFYPNPSIQRVFPLMYSSHSISQTSFFLQTRFYLQVP